MAAQKPIAFTNRAINAAKHISDQSHDTYPIEGNPGLQLRVYESGTKSLVYRYKVPLTDTKRVLKLGRWPIGPNHQSKARDDIQNDYLRHRKTRTQGRDPKDVVDIEREQERQAAAQAATATSEAEFIVRVLTKAFVDHISSENSPGFKMSWLEDQRILERYVNPVIGNKPVTDVKRPDCDAVLKPIEKAGKLVQRNRVLACTRRMWNWCIEEHLAPTLEANPWATVKQFNEVARTRVLEDGELCSFLGWLETDQEIAAVSKDAILLALHTGCRIGAVTSMKTHEVDIEKRAWTFTNHKNGSPHTVLLSRQAWAIVKRRLEGDYAFPSATRSRAQLNATTVTNDVQRSVETLKLKRFTPHDFRRTLRTWIAENGATPDEGTRVMGHTKHGVDAIYNRAALNKPAAKWWQRWSDHLATLEADNVVVLSS
jgi:integrase